MDANKIKAGVTLMVTEAGNNIFYEEGIGSAMKFLQTGDIFKVTHVVTIAENKIIYFNKNESKIPYLTDHIVENAFRLATRPGKIWRALPHK